MIDLTLKREAPEAVETDLLRDEEIAAVDNLRIPSVFTPPNCQQCSQFIL
jgi:hypothetical protein